MWWYSTHKKEIEKTLVLVVTITMGSSILSCMKKNDTTTVERNVEEYAACVGMDAANTKAMKIFVTQGTAAGFKYTMINPDTGEPWTYAESRSMYG